MTRRAVPINGQWMRRVAVAALVALLLGPACKRQDPREAAPGPCQPELLLDVPWNYGYNGPYFYVMHADDTTVYWFEVRAMTDDQPFGSYLIRSMSVNGGVPIDLVTFSYPRYPKLGFLADETHLYWYHDVCGAQWGPRELTFWRMPKAGGAPEALLQLHEIDPQLGVIHWVMDEDHLYAIASNGGWGGDSLLRIPKKGGHADVLLTRRDLARLAVDEVAVYYTDLLRPARKLLKADWTERPLVPPGVELSPYRMEVDSEFVYLDGTRPRASSVIYTSTDEMMRLPKAGTAPLERIPAPPGREGDEYWRAFQRAGTLYFWATRKKGMSHGGGQFDLGPQEVWAIRRDLARTVHLGQDFQPTSAANSTSFFVTNWSRIYRLERSCVDSVPEGGSLGFDPGTPWERRRDGGASTPAP